MKKEELILILQSQLNDKKIELTSKIQELENEYNIQTYINDLLLIARKDIHLLAEYISKLQDPELFIFKALVSNFIRSEEEFNNILVESKNLFIMKKHNFDILGVPQYTKSKIAIENLIKMGYDKMYLECAGHYISYQGKLRGIENPLQDNDFYQEWAGPFYNSAMHFVNYLENTYTDEILSQEQVINLDLNKMLEGANDATLDLFNKSNESSISNSYNFLFISAIKSSGVISTPGLLPFNCS